MKFLHRGEYVEGSLLPSALITRIWKESRGYRIELFMLMLPIPVYRAGIDRWAPMNEAYEGFYFPSWRWYSGSDESRSYEFVWHPWRVKAWSMRGRR